MTHAELTRDWQLERANLIDQLSAARRILAMTQGMLQANQLLAAKGYGEMTPVETKILARIMAYMAVGMFDQLPEGIER